MDERDRSQAEPPDEEGIPDLGGPPPKGPAGETEEGMVVPRDAPRAADDHGTTAVEHREGKSFDDRLEEETPDRARAPEPEEGRLVDEEGLLDTEKELVADQSGDAEGLSAEEAALRSEEEPPGLVGGPDSYAEETEGETRPGDR